MGQGSARSVVVWKNYLRYGSRFVYLKIANKHTKLHSKYKKLRLKFDTFTVSETLFKVHETSFKVSNLSLSLVSFQPLQCEASFSPAKLVLESALQYVSERIA